jgi:hypothetical protein
MHRRKSGEYYSQWHDHVFTATRNVETRFSVMMANMSDGDEARMRALIDQKDSDRRECKSGVDSGPS